MTDTLAAPFGLRIPDLTDRPDLPRTAVAGGRVRIGEAAFQALENGSLGKGDVLTIAQVAGILGAKQTARLLPLCQDVQLRGVDLHLELDPDDFAVIVRASVKAVGPTGVTMEALTAVSVACLTVYDLCRSSSRDAEITGIGLLAKTGGQSGDYRKQG